jgi:hypothetical protein
VTFTRNNPGLVQPGDRVTWTLNGFDSEKNYMVPVNVDGSIPNLSTQANSAWFIAPAVSEPTQASVKVVVIAYPDNTIATFTPTVDIVPNAQIAFDKVHTLPEEQQFKSRVDIDGDGHTDLLFGGNHVISWQKGMGNGEFGTTQTIAAEETNSFTALRATDMNNDGKLDILYATQSFHEATRWSYQFYWEQQSNSDCIAFSAAKTIGQLTAFETGSLHHISADLDEDGWTDFVAQTLTTFQFSNGTSSSITTYTGSANGDLTKNWLTLGDTPSGMDLGDIDGDGDGDSDIVFGYKRGGTYPFLGAPNILAGYIGWLENTGDVSDMDEHVLRYVDDASSLQLQDVNDDGNQTVLPGKTVWFT